MMFKKEIIPEKLAEKYLRNHIMSQDNNIEIKILSSTSDSQTFSFLIFYYFYILIIHFIS